MVLNNRLKVLQIIRPASGGMKAHLLSLAKNVDDHRFEMIVACPPRTSVAFGLQEMGIKVLPVDIVGGLSPIKDLQAVRELRRHIVKLRPHLIHTHGAKAGYLGRLAGILAGKPKMVSTVHNFVLENKMSYWQRELFRVLERGLANYTSSIIAVSDALRIHLIQRYGIGDEKVKTIYNGINLSDFTTNRAKFNFNEKLENATDNDHQWVGVIARLAPQKGVAYFLRAAKLVLEENPDTKFIIVGDGPEKGNLLKLTRELSLNEPVSFLGHRNDIPDILKKLDVFVLPSISEGLSITAIEALAAGCPIVATNVGGVPEIIKHGENGLLVEPKNPFDLAKGIISLLKDKQLAKNLASNGKSIAKANFDQLMMVEQTTKLYLSLLEGYLPASSNVIY